MIKTLRGSVGRRERRNRAVISHESHQHRLSGGTLFRNRAHMRYHPVGDIAGGHKTKKESHLGMLTDVTRGLTEV
jgi:hypothetical protein